MKKNNLAKKLSQKTSDTISQVNLRSVKILKDVNDYISPLQPDSVKKLSSWLASNMQKPFALNRWQKLFNFLKSSNAILVFSFVFTFSSIGSLMYVLEHSDARKDQFTSIWDGIWWGIVTVTTTGYGDHYPITPMGRIFAGLLMCFGIVASGLVTGNIASWLVDRKMRQNQGLANASHKTDHIVVCGWKNDMTVILDELMLVNPELTPEKLVIVAPISVEQLEKFRSEDRYQKTIVIRGDHYNKTILEHAGIRNARKVLVLSDESQAKTKTEADAKTVMAVMTIKKLVPRSYIAAEVKDQKLTNYLKLAQCDEIIQTEEYSKILITNSVKSSGLSHIIFDLLSVKTPNRLMTEAIPQDFIGKNFSELVKEFRARYETTAIGVLENTGNIQDLKKQALAAAQKNPNTRGALTNLKQIKTLEVNMPVLSPPPHYVIKPNSMVVLVGNFAHYSQLRQKEGA